MHLKKTLCSHSTRPWYRNAG